MSSRIASKTAVVPSVTSTLGAPQLMFLGKTERTTDPSLMRKIPPLNTCQRVRSELYKMQEGASDEVQQQSSQLRDGKILARFPGMTLLISSSSTKLRLQKRKCKMKKCGLINC